MTAERPYRGGICATHGPVEIDDQARCVLCHEQAELTDNVWRRTEPRRVHGPALDSHGSLAATPAPDATRLFRRDHADRVHVWPAEMYRGERFRRDA